MWSSLRQDRKAWESVLYRMVGRGALWTEAEINAMADFLAQTRGPEIVPIPTPTPRGAENAMRNLVAQLLTNGISRRDFVRRLVATGVTTAAANSILESVTAIAQTPGAPPVVARSDSASSRARAASTFAEQLIASGVKYIFGNSASEDAHFYEALVDRPQLQYILTPHEGPGAAMAAGYVKASGQPSIVMEAAVVGLTNALGQMFNAWKEQTPLVFYSLPRGGLAGGRARRVRGAARAGAATDADDEADVDRRARPGQIPETVRRAFRVAWTPPYGPTYMNWHSDFTSASSSRRRSSGTIRWTRGCASGRTRWRCSARQSSSSRPGVRCSSSATRSTRRRRSTRSCSWRSCWRCR